ncbi:glutamyl-tRNA reductase [Saccharospirillum sp. MSK14-1]|uniref:glutamyl-tRNA reductase n=1 Tax=Saccharospirillum sp. MSK14-1 TaxID=1897632 RepID=UPI000D3DB8B7|nr:glutamyl-tRNA reductase [Saccharospirillum sp. MSK14-1]PTY37002.1 glutamyl-tRNA reductase [Saccharospirillum sp. MSK14-1]
MSLLAIGINHQTAPIDIREKVSFAPETMSESLASVLSLPGIEETVILSTCNRSEIYCAADERSVEAVVQWLADYHNVDINQLRDALYIHVDRPAIEHLGRVAAGLDSMVLGEPQILGQLKSAFAVAQEYDSVGQQLNHLFQHSFRVAKSVRTQTAIGENAVSVAFAAVSLSTRIFDQLSKCRALLVGAGETIDLVARHLRDKGVTDLVVANRTLTRAQELAEQFGARAVLLSDIPDELPNADIVISSTASQLPIIGKGMVERALKKRRHRPVFMVDIAVPRDIEAEVGDMGDVYLYTVDDLKSVIEANVRSRREAAKEALQIIGRSTDAFNQSLMERQAADVIRQLRNKSEAMKSSELEKARRALAQGSDPEQVLEQLARGLTNKLLHAPTVALRKAHGDGEADARDWATRLFDLEDS